jgi:xylulokinase
VKTVIGVDIGTTSTVAVLLEPGGGIRATASRPTRLVSLHPGWAEQDPEEWWANACTVIRSLLETSGTPAEEVAAVAVTGMLPAVVLSDAEGRILRRSIQQSDGRCGREVQELAAEVDEAAFLARTGNGINQQLVSAKLRWLKRHEPDVHARIAHVCGSYDFVNHRLTGMRRVDRNWALEAGFLDLKTGQIAPDLVALGGIDPVAVPPPIRSDEIFGAVSAEAARQTGLRPGTPVMGGAADHIASAYAAGVMAPGDVLLKFGGAADILVATREAIPDRRLFMDYHLAPGLFMPNGCMATGGSALNWFVDTIAVGIAQRAEAEGTTPHRLLDLDAAQTPAGAEGVLIVPYFLGEKTPVHDPDARGVISGLSLSHGIGHIWRALLEGYAFAFRHHVEVIREIGYPATRFIASDGGTVSRLWMQIVADVLQVDLTVLDGHPGSCVGAAWTAAIGSGLSDDWQGVAAFVRAGETIRPNPSNAALYHDAYRAYRDTYERLRPMQARRASIP